MLILQINMIFIGSIVLFFALTTINAQNECSDRNANCINIINCPEIISILRGPRPFSQHTSQMIRGLHCGSEGGLPKVCCNQAETRASSGIPEIPDPPDVTRHPNLRLLNHQACGAVNQAKILSGNKTGIFQYPWMALIGIQRNGILEYCGGTIISSRYILTAAHCVESPSNGVRLIGVRVGDHDIVKERDCETDINGHEVVCADRYQQFSVENSHSHPQYSEMKQQNDIGLIRLNDTVNFSPRNVKPICLPFGTTAKLKLKSKAVVTGWGLTHLNRSSSELLQAKMPVIPIEQCKEIYNPDKEISYKQICAGGQINVDACNGDSGGPLQIPGIYNNTSARIIQYGVVSYGLSSCGREGIPGVYTNVAYYMDWILNTMTD